VRVHELARELGVASKDILAVLEQMGLEGRTALSSVPEEVVPRLRAAGGRPGPPAQPPRATEGSEPVMRKPPGPWLGPPPALRPTTRAARASRTPLFRTRQDRVMAAAALLLFAGSFSTFAILGRDPARSVTRVFPDVVLPVSQPRSSPPGLDLATLEAPPAAEPSPSPRPRLGLARGAGVASAGTATSSPSVAPASAVVPRSTTQAPPPTVKPSPPAPTTDPPEPPPPPPTTDPPEPSPSPSESPSPSPSPSDGEDCWPPAPPFCDDDDDD
jgi:hypothetical protein